MNKKMIFLVIGSLIIAISCNLKKHKGQENGADALSTDSKYQIKDPDSPSEIPPSPTPTPTPVPVIDRPSEKPKPEKPAELATHYNGQKLDSRVRAMAQKFGRDPSTYRLPLSDQADGTNVYREVGTHVLMNPDGDETHLPDEI